MTSRASVLCNRLLRGTAIRALPAVRLDRAWRAHTRHVIEQAARRRDGLYVVRAFVQLGELLASDAELARELANLVRQLKDTDKAIEAIHELMNPPASTGRGTGFTAHLDPTK